MQPARSRRPPTARGRGLDAPPRVPARARAGGRGGPPRRSPRRTDRSCSSTSPTTSAAARRATAPCSSRRCWRPARRMRSWCCGRRRRQRACAALGPGARFHGEIGGSDGRHGPPLAFEGRILRAGPVEYRRRSSYMTGQLVRLGAVAVVDAGGVRVVLTERRAMPFDADHLRVLGIAPEAQQILVCKSAIGWRAAFGEIAGLTSSSTRPASAPPTSPSSPTRRARTRCFRSIPMPAGRPRMAEPPSRARAAASSPRSRGRRSAGRHRLEPASIRRFCSARARAFQAGRRPRPRAPAAPARRRRRARRRPRSWSRTPPAGRRAGTDSRRARCRS